MLPSRGPYLHRPAGTFRVLAFCTQDGSGGGLFVANGGVANLDDCNVFSNQAYVRPPYAPSLSLLQRPAGTLRVLAFLAQGGAGLLLLGTATLTNTNVYENVASGVSLQSEPASTFPPAPR